ncbi:MAG: translesion error-prone DNA polymerase V autoproteolytic subunit [Flavobacterium sp.]|nr:MAG: translesion error-prone DNA polymerase V autoproteolytic subunit [Flavobacterium sp.]
MTTTIKLNTPPELVFLPGEIYSYSGIKLPLFLSRIEAGFPSPADDYNEGLIDLNNLVVSNAPETYIAEATGYSMIKAGIYPGTKLIIDKSLTFQDGDIVVCSINGEMICKRYKIIDGSVYLVPENDDFKPILLTEEMSLVPFGVVTYFINKASRDSAR